MFGDPAHKPTLRTLEAFRHANQDGMTIGLRDQSGLSSVVLSMSEPALLVMALMDGTRTCEEIRREFHESHGQTVSAEALYSLLDQLERAHFLEGSTFEAFYRSRVDAYRAAGARQMPSAVALGVLEDSSELFENMLAGATPFATSGRVAGLVAPHLDFPRGKPCYADAYATVRDRKAPDRIVILGTNHFGRSRSVVATASDFHTPLGVVSVDVPFIERLEARCGDLRAGELDHDREHSIELQVVWLQHLFGSDSFEMVPVLCPDPCGPTGIALSDGKGVDLDDFASALGELIDDDGLDTLIVAGADLSHVGRAFGDDRRLDDTFLEEVRQRDTRALERLGVNDPKGFLARVREHDNATRICSAGCIYALCCALPKTTGTLLRYHQAVDQPSQTCVTCAAVVFT